MIDLIAGRYTVRAGFGAAFDADNVGGNMLGLGISLTRANLGVSVRNFDFTNGTLPAVVTFTRAGTATYFDAAGVLQIATADQPRFDHDPVTKAPKGLLIEGSRTNAITHSNDYNNAAWIKNVSGSITLTSNAHAGLDGALTADTFATTAGAAGVLRTDVHTGLSVGNMVTMTLAVKPLTGYCKIRVGYGGTAFSTAAQAVFDLIAGTSAAYGAETTRNMTLLPSGYWLISLTATVTVAGTANVSIYSHDATAQTFAVYHSQSEIGAFGTSIIPTTTAAATRAADTAVMTGANFSRWFNPVEGTIAVDFSTFNTGISPTGGNSSYCVFDIDSAAAANSDYALFLSAAYPGYRGQVTVAGTYQAVFNSTLPLGTGALTKYALAYKANDFAASYNGGAALVDAAGTLPPAPDRIAIGSPNGGTGSRLFGHIRRIRYWPNRLSNALLQEVTA